MKRWLGESVAVFMKRPVLRAVVPCIVAQLAIENGNKNDFKSGHVLFNLQFQGKLSPMTTLVRVRGNFRKYGLRTLFFHIHGVWGFQFGPTPVYGLATPYIHTAIRSKKICHTAVVSTKHTFFQSKRKAKCRVCQYEYTFIHSSDQGNTMYTYFLFHAFIGGLSSILAVNPNR